MEEQEVNCSVCLEAFDENTHSPRTMRCGHTLCTPCLEAILLHPTHDRNCPECRKPLKITCVAHLPVSYTVLRLSRALSFLSVVAEADAGRPEDGEACLTHGLPLVSLCMTCDHWLCRQCKCKCRNPQKEALAEAILTLKQENVEEAEKSLADLGSLRDSLASRQAHVDAQLAKLREEQKQTELKLKRVDEMVSRLEDTEGELVEVTSARKMKLVKGRLRTLVQQGKELMRQSEAGDGGAAAINSSPATDALGSIARPLNGPQVDIRVLKEKLRVVETMYLVKEENGAKHVWRLSVEDQDLYIHAMSTGPTLAPGACIVNHSSFELKPENTGIFLDIHVADRMEGRVKLNVFKNKSHSHPSINFMFRAAGLHPSYPSYRGQELCFEAAVEGADSPALLQLGQELVESGHGGAVASFPVYPEKYIRRKVFPGLMTIAAPHHHQKRALVNIHLYHFSGWGDAPLGYVTNGLGVLRYAHRENNNKTSTIDDCGIFFPLGS